MNERIKELARQAGLLSARVEGTKTRVLLATVPETNGEIADPDTQLGKFAELIVKECAKVCHEQALIESEKGSLKSLYKEVALDDIGCKIAKHFGVEE